MVTTMSSLHRKGVLTLTLLLSARWASPAAGAVSYFSNFPKWSERFGGGGGAHQREGGGGGGGAFAKAARRATALEEQCASDGGDGASSASASAACPAGGGPGLPPALGRLFPGRSRLARKIGAAGGAFRGGGGGGGDDEALDDCLRKRCPSCLNVRGGHAGHAHVSDAASAAGEAAAAAAASVAAVPFGLPLNLWKVIFQAFLTTMNVLCWLVPLRSEKISNNKLALSLANAFSGGVFLSLAFGHLIPECVHGFGPEFNEALPYMLVLGGYLLIFFVEKVAFDAHGLMHINDEGHDHHGHHTHGHKKEEAEAAAVANGTSNKDATPADNQGEGEGLSTGRSAVILLGALAVHSVLEMTALGLANTFGESALMSLSIALHQPAESIALLVAFLKSGMPKAQIVRYLSVFSAMGPVGVAIGMAVNEFAAPIVDAVMLAVVAGTFVYVGATEVIPEEWEESEHKWKKFFALISGILSIFAITQYTMTLEAH